MFWKKKRDKKAVNAGDGFLGEVLQEVANDAVLSLAAEAESDGDIDLTDLLEGLKGLPAEAVSEHLGLFKLLRSIAYNYDVVDLFSGIGWDAQLDELDLRAFGIDYDKHVVKLRSDNSMPTLRADLWTMRPADLGLTFQGLIASPSCKKWSAAGLKEAHSELNKILAAIPAIRDGKALNDVLSDVDPEAALVLAPLEWAVYHRPVWIALEQVRQVQPVWDAIAVALRELGYSVDTGILHAEQYGTPQTRDRAILVANRDVEVTLPKPTHSRYYSRNPPKRDPGVQSFVTIAEALGWERGGDNTAVPYPKAMRSNYGTGGDPKNRGIRTVDEPAPTVTSKIGRNQWMYHTGSDQEPPEWVFNRPSTTVVGSFKPEVIAAPGYRKAGDGPRQNAHGSGRVTPEESARLQGFPEWVNWAGIGKSAREQIIGNAVPGQLARAVIQAARGGVQ